MGKQAADLRGQLRGLVKDHVPEHFLGAFTDDPADLDTAQRFCRTLADRNLLCLAWPEEFGGGGASVWEQTVVREEMWAHHEPRGAQYMGVNWVGPIIMRHGTQAQQRTHLPPIAAGEVIWCQGFSEPEAGSDLASLRTAARPDGDGWLVTGQKIWTSYATMAQWCFLLARTSRVGEGAARKKQHGLTIFLVRMDDPAITVRPISCMMGPHLDDGPEHGQHRLHVLGDELGGRRHHLDRLQDVDQLVLQLALRDEALDDRDGQGGEALHLRHEPAEGLRVEGLADLLDGVVDRQRAGISDRGDRIVQFDRPVRSGIFACVAV